MALTTSNLKPQLGFTNIYSPEKPTFNIIFIHGLNGSPIQTWTKNTTFWPSTFLPTHFPTARIFTYGHLAARDIKRPKQTARSIKVLGESLVTDFEDLIASDLTEGVGNGLPTIWICHSLGGIIVKHALSESRRLPASDSRRALASSISSGAILFLGVPHRGGAPLTEFARRLAKAGKAIGLQTNDSLAKQLMNDSSELRDVLKDFPYAREDLSIYVESFFERDEIKGVGGKVVDEFSASLYTGERVTGLPGDHSGMCKFESEEDEGFCLVRKAIERCVQQFKACEIPRSAGEVGGRMPVMLVPAVAKVQKFYGRESDLRAISTAFQNSTQKVPVVVLQGIGGQGKTQLALEYCEREHRAGSDIFWIDATEERTASQGFERLFELLISQSQSSGFIGMDKRSTIEAVQTTKSLLSNRNEKWILVFDNQDDPERFPNFAAYFPASYTGAGRIIVTSRHPESVRYGSAVYVGKMAKDDAVNLLLSQSGNTTTEELVSEEPRSAAAAVVQTLCYHPLAIDQAASYIRTTGLHLSQFAEFYDKERETVLKHTAEYWEYKKIPDTEERAVSTSAFVTWELSFSQINKPASEGKCSGEGLDRATIKLIDGSMISPLGYLLTLCAFFCHNYINEEVIRAGEKQSENKVCFQSLAFHDGSWSSSKFQLAMGKLVNSSLLQRNEKHSDKSELAGAAGYTIHGLVHQWIKLRLPAVLRTFFTRRAIKAVGELISEDWLVGHPQTHEKNRLILMQVSAIALNAERFLPRQSAAETLYFRTIMKECADAFRERNQLMSAVDIYMVALKEFPEEERVIWEEKCALARVIAESYFDFGKYKEAATFYEKALDILETYSPKAPTISESSNISAADKRTLHLLYLQLLYTTRLCVSLQKASQLSKSHSRFQPLITQLTALPSSLYITSHPIMNAIHNLAEHFVQQSLYAGTLPAQKIAHEGFTNLYGSNSLPTAIALFNLGKNQKLQENFVEAVETLKKALEVFVERTGVNHPWTLATIEALGRSYLVVGRAEDARRLYARYNSIFSQSIVAGINSSILRLTRLIVETELDTGNLFAAVEGWGRAIAAEGMTSTSPELRERIRGLTEITRNSAGEDEKAEPIDPQLLSRLYEIHETVKSAYGPTHDLTVLLEEILSSNLWPLPRRLRQKSHDTGLSRGDPKMFAEENIAETASLKSVSGRKKWMAKLTLGLGRKGSLKRGIGGGAVRKMGSKGSL